jgi:hypothetical protein
MIGQTVTIPVCSGSLLTVQAVAGQFSLVCSAQWTTASGLLIDPAYSSELGLMLDNGGIDWSVTYQVMGYALGFWFLGAIYGFMFNLLRRAKAR